MLCIYFIWNWMEVLSTVTEAHLASNDQRTVTIED